MAEMTIEVWLRELGAALQALDQVERLRRLMGVTTLELAAVVAIAESGPLTEEALGRRFGLSRGGARALVERLAGLALARRGHGDGVTLTAAAARELTAAAPRRRGTGPDPFAASDIAGSCAGRTAGDPIIGMTSRASG